MLKFNISIEMPDNVKERNKLPEVIMAENFPKLK